MLSYQPLNPSHECSHSFRMQPTPRATKRTSAQSNHPICALKSSSTSPTALWWLVTHKQIPHSLNRYSSADETAVCNLASLNLQKFIACAQVQCQPCSARRALIDLVQQAPGSRPYFDFERLVTDHVFCIFQQIVSANFPYPAGGSHPCRNAQLECRHRRQLLSGEPALTDITK